MCVYVLHLRMLIGLVAGGSHMSYDVYPDDVDDLSKEAYLEMYLKETNPIICESDDEFINMCKQIKGK